MRHLAVLSVAGLSFALAGCDFDDFDSSERVQSDFHFTYPLKDGGTVGVETFNGTVEIVGWDQNTVDIAGTKYARSEPLRDQIKIETSHSEGAVSVRAIHPFDSHGNMGAKFIIHVPRKAELDRIVSSNGHIEVRNVSGGVKLRTSNGAITAESIDGPLDATTSNGRITVRETNSTSRVPLHLQTSNGAIDLTAEKPLLSDVHASTSNGSITLRLPASTVARVRASTSNASISSDFEVSSDGRTDKHRLEGNMNNARGDAPLIDISTSNGGIRLAKL